MCRMPKNKSEALSIIAEDVEIYLLYWDNVAGIE